ncbi:MAG: GPP34 family phosphoprotein [Planctomycetota bacterium]
MPNKDDLYLYEEILLLALKDEAGTIANGTWYAQALGGAILTELLLRERIRVNENDKKRLVSVVSTQTVDDSLLDEALQNISAAKWPKTLADWVGRCAGLSNIKQRVAEGLCKRRILRADAKKVLLIFTRKIYPEVDPKPEMAIIDRLHKAIFTQTRDIDPRTIVLLSLANSSNLLQVVFDNKKLKERKTRIERVVNGEEVGKATAEAVQALQTAVAVSAVLPAIMTPVIISN